MLRKRFNLNGFIKERDIGSKSVKKGGKPKR